MKFDKIKQLFDFVGDGRMWYRLGAGTALGVVISQIIGFELSADSFNFLVWCSLLGVATEFVEVWARVRQSKQ